MLSEYTKKYLISGLADSKAGKEVFDSINQALANSGGGGGSTVIGVYLS